VRQKRDLGRPLIDFLFFPEAVSESTGEQPLVTRSQALLAFFMLRKRRRY